VPEQETVVAPARPEVSAAPRPPAAVSLDRVGVRVPGRPAPLLDDITVGIAPGEEVLVLGASGSGKSTLLSVVVGTVPHAVAADLVGSVCFGGIDVTDREVVDRSRVVGRLVQDPAAGVCLPTVEQDLALTCENHGVDPAAIDGRIQAALTLVGADALRRRAAATLSGGELQRAALAAVVTVPPPVLVLDEPTSMLDPAGVTAVRSAVAAIRARHAPAVVIVEHRLDDWAGPHGTAGLPPRTVVLDGGRVLLDGPTSAVLHDHAARLHSAGCWLPLETELRAVFGAPPDRLIDAVPAAARSVSPGSETGTTTGRAPSPAQPAVLRTRDLVAGRDGRAVLSGVDLDVCPGELIAVVGANGGGKSTLLLTLAGLLPPVEGTVHGRRPGVVFQNPEHGFIGRTAAADIAAGLDRHDAAAVVPARLDAHRLGHVATQNPFRLSGGEKRRLSLASMLAHQRPVLIADEPTYGLDRRDAQAAARALREAASAGTAVLISTHDLRLVATCADRLLVLGRGGVLADGPTLPLLRDERLTAAAGLRLPALLTRLFAESADDSAVLRVLRFLDDAPAMVAR
jgi:energy-coupling factor transporter ATP-binding protein EcfA2